MNRIRAVDTAATEALGTALAGVLRDTGVVVYLQGELGAGKTTLVRAVARGLGITGAVRSPTYTLVEGYELPQGMLYHLDLYRIAAIGELEFLGIRELEAPDNRVFIEWPERAAGGLPAADLELLLEAEGEGRVCSVRPRTPRGEQILANWQSQLTQKALETVRHGSQ
ncbi:MAG TPA: tRNA (adenosine(37)-N6)-threonylcarbamoyltransferase complex ATPase subunit type 1 TsaE [Gammaproteobacteria bacterium]|nr:tRNA (adenosine(37)-N6)-threonylcarbamoyltransferase complex ATPase subunit type 1 TsaE [Gammaproteobacteria bacterium]